MSVIDAEDEIILRCVADNRPEFLEKAVLNGWKQCKICKYVICNECLSIFLPDNNSESVCPGTYLKYNHNLVIENIPTEIIIIDAKKHSKLPSTGILINKAFYSDNEETVFGDDESSKFLNKYENQAVSLAKKEEWSNMGSVIVKRNRGKYISWERI